MNLLFSAKDGYAALGFRRFLLALMIAWLAPSFIAALALLVQYLGNTTAMGDPGLMAWALSVLLLASPMLGWLSLLLAAPFVAVLMDRGWFGWTPVLGLGLICGAFLGYMMSNLLVLSFGTAQIALVRLVLGQLQPAAFRQT